MICLYPRYLKSQNIWVPCGRCRACRIVNVMQLSLRAYHEFLMSEKACFLTLTYSDENIPVNAGLCYQDFLNFWKYFKKLSKLKNLKYLVAGEYGGQFGRPHFHAVLYGVDKSYKDLIKKAWRNRGFIDIQPCSKASFGYVAKYNLKTQKEKEDDYISKGIIPPFVRISKGLGKSWVEAHREELERSLVINEKGKTIALPQYYWRLLNYSRDTKADYCHPKKNHLRFRREYQMAVLLNDMVKQGVVNPDIALVNIAKDKASRLIGRSND